MNFRLTGFLALLAAFLGALILLWDGDEMVSGHADNDGDLTYHRCGQVFRATHWMLPEPPGEEVEG